MNTSFADIEKKENRKDLIISICVFLSGFSCFAQLYYFQPLLPDLAKDFILSASESSFAISFSTLGMVFGLFTTMFVADRIPRKKMIGTGLLSSSIFSVAASFSPTFLPLILLSAAKGFLLSGATSVSMAYIAEEVSSRNKGKIMGLYIAGNALGGMAGRVISSWIGALYTWRIASVSIGLICALFAILFLLFSPRSTNFMPRKESFHTLIIANLQLITSKALIPFYLTGGLILGVFVSLYNYLGFYLTKAPFNFPEHYIHYIYLMYIFGIFGSIATAGLTRYFTHFKVLKAMFLVSAAGILLLYITGYDVPLYRNVSEMAAVAYAAGRGNTTALRGSGRTPLSERVATIRAMQQAHGPVFRPDANHLRPRCRAKNRGEYRGGCDLHACQRDGGVL